MIYHQRNRTLPKSIPLYQWTSFRATKNLGNVEIEHRHHSKANRAIPSRTISLWINGLAFSVKPLRMATLMGFFCAIIGLIAGIYIIVQKVLFPDILLGYTSLMSALLFIGGMLMLILGLIGEYIGRIYICINQSPKYVVRDTIN